MLCLACKDLRKTGVAYRQTLFSNSPPFLFLFCVGHKKSPEKGLVGMWIRAFEVIVIYFIIKRKFYFFLLLLLIIDSLFLFNNVVKSTLGRTYLPNGQKDVIVDK